MKYIYRAENIVFSKQEKGINQGCRIDKIRDTKIQYQWY